MTAKRNYQKELDELIARNMEAGIRPRLLVHSCCAPCSSYVMEYLSRYFDLTMFFYNPNMDSREEYEKRAAELKRLIGEMNRGIMKETSDNGTSSGTFPCRTPIRLIVEEYDPEPFEKAAFGHENDPERGERCRRCYALRLRRTAEYMRQYNLLHKDDTHSDELPFDYFATTLTLSPLKDAAALNEIAEQLAAQFRLHCLVTDFKKKDGYKRSIALSQEYGLYRQDYCGCRYSKAARKAHKSRDMDQE